MTQKRKIKLEKGEYIFPFSNPLMAQVKCTVIDGAGTITLYEIRTSQTGSQGNPEQVGDSHFLSREPGNAYYVSLNTTNQSSKWEIAFRGTGTFELELPDRLLSPSVKGRRSGLSAKIYDRHGNEKTMI